MVRPIAASVDMQAAIVDQRRYECDVRNVRLLGIDREGGSQWSCQGYCICEKNQGRERDLSLSVTVRAFVNRTGSGEKIGIRSKGWLTLDTTIIFGRKCHHLLDDIVPGEHCDS